MLKTKIFPVIRAVVFILIFAVLFSTVTFVFRNKNEANIVLPFYDEPKDSLDVIFIGSSHVMCSVYPMELYDQFGIASYNFASSSQLLPQSYYQLKEALRVQSPSLVVLDVSGVLYNDKMGSKDYAHVQFDNMPAYSPVKYEAIFDLVEPSSRAEYIFNIVRFHSRWKSLSKNDFKDITSLTKGAYFNTGCTSFEVLPEITPEDKKDIYPVAEEYLRKVINLCKERGVNLMLYNAPTTAGFDSLCGYNKVGDFAEEYGLHYVNMIHKLDEIGFDPKTDFRDQYHCNASGALKVTKYVGEFIKTHFDLPDRRNDDAYNFWDDQLTEYRSKYSY